MQDATRPTRRPAPGRSVIVVLSVLVAASVASAVTEQLALATAVVGVLIGAAALPGFQLLRRLSTVMDVAHRDAWTGRQLILEEIRSQLTRSSASAGQLEVAQRRILAVSENARLAAADCHRELLAKIDTATRETGRRQQEQTREIEALLQLYRGFLPRAPMPPVGGWELNASGLLGLVSLIEQHPPETVLELGSGTSSVWLSYALQKSGGRLVSVDHMPESVERTRAMLSRHSLDHLAEIRHAPLRAYRAAADGAGWYTLDAFEGVSEVGLLVVDGPRSAGPVARYAALQALERRLAASATIFLTYTDGPDERNLILRWTESFPGLVWDRAAVGRHAVLRYSRRVNGHVSAARGET